MSLLLPPVAAPEGSLLTSPSQKPPGTGCRSPCSLGEEGISKGGGVRGLFILYSSFPPLHVPLLSVPGLYGHNGMVSLSVKLLVLNWIGPFAALQFFFS